MSAEAVYIDRDDLPGVPNPLLAVVDGPPSPCPTAGARAFTDGAPDSELTVPVTDPPISPITDLVATRPADLVADPLGDTPGEAPGEVVGEVVAEVVVDPREAEDFLRLFHAENPNAGPAEPRIAVVLEEIA